MICRALAKTGYYPSYATDQDLHQDLPRLASLHQADVSPGTKTHRPGNIQSHPADSFQPDFQQAGLAILTKTYIISPTKSSFYIGRVPAGLFQNPTGFATIRDSFSRPGRPASSVRTHDLPTVTQAGLSRFCYSQVNRTAINRTSVRSYLGLYCAA